MHYIALSGQPGCLPDHCEVFETRREAVDDLADLFELSRRRKRELRQVGHLWLRPNEGAAYCEIFPCPCSSPHLHSDRI